MRTIQSPASPAPRWSRLARAYEGLIHALGLIAGGLFVLMAFCIGADVLMRNFTGRGLGWIIELMEYLMFVATTLAAPWILREGGHVSVDILNTQLSPRWQRRVLRLASLLGMLICAAVGYYSASATWQAFERGSRVVKSFVFPEWWLNAFVPLCMLMMVIEFAKLALAAPHTLELADINPHIEKV